uniref:Ig-like domain-containing protein n=1 Tax=Erpetoichthys calabaricus TaxID=27687 RepID=A0A8C4RS05_ERPCA
LSNMQTLSSSHAVNIIQEPDVLIVKSPAETVTLHCKHNDNTQLVMLWYRQMNSKGMTLVAFSYGSGDIQYEDGFKGNFTMTRLDTLQSTLKINRIKPEDTGVYICASSMTH